MENFSFEHNGNTYWYSRSMTSVCYVFCKNKQGVWCVLANQRGPNAPSCVGLWNVPCGYLDHNETIKDAACRETREETGVVVLKNELNFWKLTTVPDKGKQNMNCQFYVKLKGNTEENPVSSMFNEPGETSDIKWIPVSEIDKYKFAFKQKPNIYEIFNNFIEPSIMRKCGLYILNKLRRFLKVDYIN